jgi:hypothetical protein
MTQDSQRTFNHDYMGFEVRENHGWFVALLHRDHEWKVFEAESRNVLEHKIRRWWSIH